MPLSKVVNKKALKIEHFNQYSITALALQHIDNCALSMCCKECYATHSLTSAVACIHYFTLEYPQHKIRITP